MLAIKVFFLDDNDNLKRIPLARYRKLRQGEGKPYPDLAGNSVRAIQVLVEYLQGKPVSIVKLYYPLHEFNEKGEIDQELMKEALRFAVLARDNEFVSLEYQRIHFWDPKSIGEEILYRKIHNLIFS